MAFVSSSEYLKMARALPSEQRLMDMPSGSWSPRAFADATDAFSREQELNVRILADGESLLSPSPESRFKYQEQYEDLAADSKTRGRSVVAIATRGGRTVGFGIAASTKTHSTIKVILDEIL